MSLSLVFDIADDDWFQALPNVEELARTATIRAMNRAAPEYATRIATVEIGLTFAGDDFVRQLNHQYRSKDKPTNVLSFPAAQPPGGTDDVPVLLGDIVLARETVTREAAEGGKDLAAHTQHLIVHGVLHLLGHDHATETDAEHMESLEIEILYGIGIANPYNALTDDN